MTDFSPSSFVSHSREELLTVLERQIKILEQKIDHVDRLGHIRARRIKNYIRQCKFLWFKWECSSYDDLGEFGWEEISRKLQVYETHWKDILKDLRRLRFAIESTSGEQVYVSYIHANYVFKDYEAETERLINLTLSVPDGYEDRNEVK